MEKFVRNKHRVMGQERYGHAEMHMARVDKSRKRCMSVTHVHAHANILRGHLLNI